MAQIAAFVLALARPQAPRLPASVQVRGLALVVAVVLLGVLSYVGARETALFAVTEIDVAGAPPPVAEEVRKVARSAVGTSLVGVDGDELERRVAELPSVRAVEYDRAFPSTLRIVVSAERPVAVVRLGPRAWLASDDGRVIRSVEPGTLRSFPRIWAPADRRASPGGELGDDDVRLALRALAAVPPRFPVRVLAARAAGGEVTVVVAGGVEVRLGAAADLPLKLEVAKRVLEAIGTADRSGLAYVDVSVPARPVAAE